MKISPALIAAAAFAIGLAGQAAPSPAEVPLPKWAQGTWADNKFATCAQINDRNGFRDGGFVTISGAEIGGHEWRCRATRKTGKGEFDLNCEGEGEEYKSHVRLQKSGSGMLTHWRDVDTGAWSTTRYVEWCRMGPPAFWGN